ncbi:hypothetical protein BT96DRAFT_997539 [Gymnopus androsaceus JB14]|uniref:Uncharacterized protein n=1 Tax=Gymnopus androsaceus JB14 TaxID=1447944 RepID=A0A6A4HCT3_9AGAR|nr:hypothetical protein BT96DRAFT_997539 [Gymnopus androsaceus JB14]
MAAATVILPTDIVPHMSDLQAIISTMENAYLDGDCSVHISLDVDGEFVTGTYHFSKIRLFVSINNNSNSLPPALFGIWSHATIADASQPPPFLFLPTCFIKSAQLLFCISGHDANYSPELHALHEHLKATAGFTLSFVGEDNSHYSGYHFDNSESLLKFGDSLFGNPPEDLEQTLQWITPRDPL